MKLFVLIGNGVRHIELRMTEENATRRNDLFEYLGSTWRWQRAWGVTSLVQPLVLALPDSPWKR